MILKILLGLLLFGSLPAFEQDDFFPLEKIDTSDWIQFVLDEEMEIAFPKEPELLEENGIPYLSATDEEGMTFSLTSIPLPEGDFSLKEYFDLIHKELESSLTLLASGHPDPNPNDSGYFLLSVEEKELSALVFLRGPAQIYLLMASTCNDVYLNIDALEADTETFDILVRDTAKIASFANSLKLIDK